MDIKDWEGAITCIETASKFGIILVPSGDRLEIQPPGGDYDKDAFNIVVGQLKQGAEMVKAILLDGKACAEMLSKTKDWLAEDTREFTPVLDLWVRLGDISENLLLKETKHGT